MLGAFRLTLSRYLKAMPFGGKMRELLPHRIGSEVGLQRTRIAQRPTWVSERRCALNSGATLSDGQQHDCVLSTVTVKSTCTSPCGS